MTDNRTETSRSALMARIGGKNTAPELAIRARLHAMGYRYRLHAAALPGKPDIVFPGRGKVVFVHGCFWHGHGCGIGRPPKSRLEYWLPKLAANKARDRRREDALAAMGWSALTVWQCQLKRMDETIGELERFLGPRGRAGGHRERSARSAGAREVRKPEPSLLAKARRAARPDSPASPIRAIARARPAKAAPTAGKSGLAHPPRSPGEDPSQPRSPRADPSQPRSPREDPSPLRAPA